MTSHFFNSTEHKLFKKKKKKKVVHVHRCALNPAQVRILSRQPAVEERCGRLPVLCKRERAERVRVYNERKKLFVAGKSEDVCLLSLPAGCRHASPSPSTTHPCTEKP